MNKLSITLLLFTPFLFASLSYKEEAKAEVKAEVKEEEAEVLWASLSSLSSLSSLPSSICADCNMELPQGTTWLHDASLRGRAWRVQSLIEAGADVNAKTEYGKTPLHIAADYDKLEIVKLLIEAGADVNAKDEDGETPLHIVAYYGKLEIVKALIEARADVCAKDHPKGDGDWTPLMDAKYKLTNRQRLAAKDEQEGDLAGRDFVLKQAENFKKIIKVIEAEMRKQNCLEDPKPATHPSSR